MIALLLLLGVSCASGPKAGPMPQGASFEGHWDSNFQRMELRQEGKRVHGIFQYREGSLDGTLDGDLLKFRWWQRENKQTGRGYLQISGDGTHLEGRWGYED